MQQWDYRLFTVINNIAGHNRFLDTMMVFIAKWGAAAYGLLLLYLFFSGRDYWEKTANRKIVVRAVLSALTALVVNQLIGLAYFRPRPFAAHEVKLLIDRSPDPSFPSDHAAGSGALTSAVLPMRRGIGTLMVVLTVLLVVSRVYVGTHYPLDVLGGILTGCLGSYIIRKSWPLWDGWITKLLDLWASSTMRIAKRVSGSQHK